MSEMNKIIPIFFTIDNGYAPYLDTAVASLIENASKDNKYKIIVLHEGVTEINQNRIKAHANDIFDIEFVEMKQEIAAITDRVENRLRCDYFTMTIYFRLFIADMFPQYDKGIYLDSDIIVPGDISKMYDQELGENLIGACRDHSIENIPELLRYMVETIGIKTDEYINSGILLMNLKKLRDTEFSKHFLYLLGKYHFDSVAPDQDYLNAICNGKILYMDRSWDAMPNNDSEPLKNPMIIHYNLFEKPWCYDNIQYQDYFWNYAKKSAFYDEIVEHKNTYSDEQKELDQQSLGTIVSKAGTMDKNEYTFRKVRENGEKVRI